jgi:hypothetical protein
MKPGPNYRMSAQAKRFAATIANAHERGAYKRAMIDAELSSAVQMKREKGRKEQRGE